MNRTQVKGLLFNAGVIGATIACCWVIHQQGIRRGYAAAHAEAQTIIRTTSVNAFYADDLKVCWLERVDARLAQRPLWRKEN